MENEIAWEDDDKKHYKKNGYPKKGYRHYVVPPNVEAGITGVVSSWQNPDGSITLLYSDQTEETTGAGQPLMQTFKSFFSIVSHVQDQRGMQ